MEYLKFIPEGWNETNNTYELSELKQAYQNGDIIQGFVHKYDDNYNLHVKLNDNIEGVIPRNEIDYLESDEMGFVRSSICKNKVNTFVQFKIKEIYNDNRLILSRKSANLEAIDWMNKNLAQGQIVPGIVKNIRKYGVFIEIGAGVVGLLNIEDISVSRIKSPEERFHIGQKINVMIKSIDNESKKIFFTYKELFGTWEDNIKDFSVGTVVKGIIRESDKFKNGIFIELKPNLVGMAEYKDGYQYGQTVDVYIKRIIDTKRKVKLVII